MRIFRYVYLCVSFLLVQICQGQELEARVSVNHQQVEGSNASVFESLEKNITAFLNERQWTNLQFKRNERIACSFSITISKYEEGEGLMEGSLMVQSTRPVFNSSYTTTVFSTQDPNFRFLYKEFDQLEFRPEVIDNDLTALLAYYAYLIIFSLFTRKLFNDCSNTTRTYSTSTFSDSECKTLFHSDWMDKFDSHFDVVTRHTHFCTCW